MRMPEVYGGAFSYAQFFLARSTWAMVTLVSRVMMLFAMIRFEAGRKRLFETYRPGTGPSAEKRARSTFRVSAIAETVDGRTSRVDISGGDPGYDDTSKMVAQAAFCLIAKHRAGTLTSGVLTPVEAFGEELVGRLEGEGIEISRK
jgi:short subunit dehydrogenase-like uncharacterized protein